MGFLKRALVSIIRKKPQSLILLLVVFILGNIMISTLLIVQSVNGTKDTILKELPPVVSLEIDYDKLYADQHSMADFSEIPWITFDDLERIEAACGAYIKSYDYSSSYGLETASLKRYRLEEEDFVTLPRAEAGTAIFPMNEYFMLQGVGIPNFILLEIGDAEIMEGGRTFTEDEIKNGSPVLIMSKELAEINNLRVGDLVEIECLFTDITDEGEQEVFGTILLEMELVGILEYKKPLRAGNNQDFDHEEFMLAEKKNTLITSNRFVADYMEKTMDILIPYYRERFGEEINPWADYNPLAGMPITYILNSSEDADNFVRTAAAALNNEFYKFTTQEDNFKRVAGPLESMKRTLTFAFYITVGSAIVVLALVLFGFMWARQKEIGIYLALGERKMKITAQMVVESAAIGLIGAALALASGLFLASYISDLLIATPSPDELGMIIGPITNNYLSNIDFESVMKSYQVGLSGLAVVKFFISILATTIVSQLIASLYILRLDPKKILM